MSRSSIKVPDLTNGTTVCSHKSLILVELFLLINMVKTMITLHCNVSRPIVHLEGRVASIGGGIIFAMSMLITRVRIILIWTPQVGTWSIIRSKWATTKTTIIVATSDCIDRSSSQVKSCMLFFETNLIVKEKDVDFLKRPWIKMSGEGRD